MNNNYVIRKRQNKILYLEFFMVAIVAAVLSTNYFKLQPGIGLLIGIAVILLVFFLFFTNQIFRYSFSILFSLTWAFIAFLSGQYLNKSSDTAPWIFAILAFIISLWAHKNHFSFLKSAKLYEYEIH